MTDSENIKAFECCEANGGQSPLCDVCPYHYTDEKNDPCYIELRREILKILNRKQAKIESLNNALRVRKNIAGRETVYVEIAKAKAIKELEDKTHKIITDIYNKHIFGRDNDLTDEEKDAIINFSDDIVSVFENIVKEIVGDTE